MAWTRPSRNDCSSRAAWYSAFSLRSPCSLAVRIRAMTCGPLDPGQLVELGPQPGVALGGQRDGVRDIDGRRSRCFSDDVVAGFGVARAARGARGATGRRLAVARLAARSVGIAVGHALRAGSAAVAATTARRSVTRSARSLRRSPVGRRRFANGRITPPVGKPGPLRRRDALGERGEQRVLVLLGRGGRGPPDPDALEGCGGS